MHTIRRRTTPKGTHLHIQIREGQGSYQPPVLVVEATPPAGNPVTVTGTPILLRPEHVPPQERAAVKAALAEGFAAMIKDHGTRAIVFLLHDEVAALEAATAEWKTAQPDVIFRERREQREGLLRHIAALQDVEAQEKDRAWERGDELRAVTDSDDFRAKLRAARQALAEFDAAYPEVVGRIERERQAEVRRLIDNGL